MQSSYSKYVLLLILGLNCAYGQEKQATNIAQPLKFSQGRVFTRLKPIKRVYSEEDMRSFAEAIVLPVIGRTYDAKLPYREINDRVLDQNDLYDVMYGTHRVETVLFFGQHSFGPYIFGTAKVINGEPKVIFYLSAFIQYADALRKEEVDWDEHMESMIIYTMMHERDHLLSDTNKSQLDISDEANTHALTTEFVTTPLVEKYGKGRYEEIAEKYNAWVQNGRVNNTAWHEYIAKKYKEAVPQIGVQRSQ